MASVNNLKIALQSGSDNVYFATWEFEEYTKSTTISGGTVKVGDLVTIKDGATYYNGVPIPGWVMADQWYVIEVDGDRAVLGENDSGANDIQSPINVKYLEGGSGGTTTTTSTKTLDHYEVKWVYATGDGVSFEGSSDEVTVKNATYSPPANATKVKVTVKPVSKTYTSNGKETTYWTGSAVSDTYLIANNPPEVPPTPSVTIDKFQLTATVENITDPRTDEIYFEVNEAITDSSSSATYKRVTVFDCRASYTCNILSGYAYRVRVAAINIKDTERVYSEWTDYVGPYYTVPDSVTGVSCAAESKTSVKVTWTAIETADSYEVQYTTNKTYFDSTSGVQSVSGITNAYAIVTGLESGDEWFFRVRAVNEQGESGWSEIVSTVIGTRPEAPTTWSLTTTAYVGEKVVLYWTHNSEDGSKQTGYQLEYTVDGGTPTVVEEQSSVPEDEDEPIYSYTLNTNSYSDGGEIKWRVRTKGIYEGDTDDNTYSNWSTMRTINLYAPPTLTVSLPHTTLTSFPLNISANAGPNSQTPLAYHVSIKARDSYETTDVIGNEVMVSAGTEVYSKVINTSEHNFSLSLSAGDVMFESGESYDITVLVSMNSGLTAEATQRFLVNWTDRTYIPDASIAIDFDTLCAHITPHCINTSGDLASNVTLAVYRREYDGTFTEIASGLTNSRSSSVTDPHPSLDYARYRIVATDTSTGNVSYEDLPGQPIGEPSIVIQWDEKWSAFDNVGEAEQVYPAWSGSMLRLRGNVDTSEQNSPDVALIEYIGRDNPVSYYGTQRGETATWNTDVPKSDKETIYALRRLKAWSGDVYVREPSGTGYWAHVLVSFSTKHLAMVVPVTFAITRVEGGM